MYSCLQCLPSWAFVKGKHISRLDVTSKVTGCIEGEEKGKDNNEHLSELFLPMSFYIGCLKQNANEI